MPASGLEVFDRTLQTTRMWLNEIAERIGPDRQLARHALGALPHALRDRVPLALAAHVCSQRPLLVRGLCYGEWRPSDQPEKTRTLDGFLDRVAAGLTASRPPDAGEAAQAVFRVLSHQMDPGQVGNTVEALPKPVQDPWTAVAAVRFPANDQRRRSGTAAA